MWGARETRGDQADAAREQLQFGGFVVKVALLGADVPVTTSLAQRRCFVSMGQVDAKA